MTSVLYTKESVRTWYRDEGNDGKQLWEFMTVSDIAYTIFVLKNHGEVWKQDWKLHEDNHYTSNVEKEKYSECKKMTKAQMVTNGMSIEERRRYMKIKPRFTYGEKKISFCDDVKEEGIEFYKKTL